MIRRHLSACLAILALTHLRADDQSKNRSHHRRRLSSMKTISPRAAALLCALSLLTSCGKPALNVGPGSRDFSRHLAGDYYLIRTSPEEVQISPTGYNPDVTPVIPKTVQAYATDGHWIIARTTNPENDSTPPASEGESYWILDASKKSLHGPFSLQEFTQTRESLGVPPGLELQQRDNP